MRRHLCAILTTAIVAVCLSGAARATSYALLVGASAYPEPQHRLAGPPNDVALLWQVIVEQGFARENVRVLADALGPHDGKAEINGPPHRADIMAALSELARTAEDGDFVLLYFSGHGSRQPARDGAEDEADGFDEIFLPSDVGRWGDEERAVENAIVDNEIGVAVRALRERGAFVWLIVDACNSGTMNRAVSDDLRIRRLPPKSLGVPASLLEQARAAGAKTRSLSGDQAQAAPWDIDDEGGQGGVVAFFAAQADEVAYEDWLPKSYDDDKQMRGLLSYSLARALMANPGATYHEVAQRIRLAYDSFGGQPPTPLFEGDLDQALFGGGAVGRNTHPVKITDDDRLLIDAGHLHGLSEGATVALRAADADEDQAPVTAQARDVGLLRSELELRDGDVFDLPTRLLGTIVETAVDLTLRVARPYPAAVPESARVSAALDLLTFEADTAGARALDVVEPDAPADIYLRVADGQVWLVPSSGEWHHDGRGRTPALSIAPTAEEMARVLEQRLRGIATGLNLMKVAGALGTDALAGKLTVEAFILRDTAATAAQPTADPPDARKCQSVPRRRVAEDASAVALGSLPRLFHCDTVYLRISNIGPHPIDVSGLFLDSEGLLHPLDRIWRSRRIEPGAAPEVLALQTETWNLRRQTPSTVGLERLVLIGAERGNRDDLAVLLDFGYLARSVQGAGGAQRSLSGPLGALQSLLNTAVAGQGQSRSASVSTGSGFEQAAIHVIRWDLRPPPGL